MSITRNDGELAWVGYSHPKCVLYRQTQGRELENVDVVSSP